jgi:hypothetical protein
MSTKLLFTFATEASPTCSKTTVLRVKSMQFSEDGLMYVFPNNLQGTEEHEKLMQTSAAKLVKKALDTRGKIRTINITLSSELYTDYVDDDGNAVFKDTLLEQWTSPPRSTAYPSFSSSSSASVAPVTELISQATPQKKPLSTLLKDVVIQKFGTRPTNALSWIEIFESECVRLEVPENRYWEAIRLFLEGSALDWYDSRRITFKNASWERWRMSFLDSFAQKGWNEARSAMSYRYMTGSLGEYALKKENLLINFHSKIDEVMKIALIVLGLPFTIQEKIDPSEISSVSELLRKLNSFERPRSISNSDKLPLLSMPSAFSSLKPRTPCPYCSKKGFQRFHSESNCRTKAYDLENKKPSVFSNTSNVRKTPENRTINTVNASEANNLVNEILEQQKNE